MKQKLLLLPICVTLATPFATAAPGGPPPPGGGGPPMADPVSDALDRNQDGELSKHEIKRAPRVLKRLDRNRDGELAGEEIGQPEEDNQRPMGPPPSEVFMTLDIDDDGVLSSAEMEKASESLIKLDTDQDGELSTEEFGSQPPQENGGPPEGNGGPTQGGQGGGDSGHGPPPGPRRR